MNLNQFLQILKQQSESTAFEEIWQWLSSKVTGLLGGESLSPSSFDEIYTKVFNACIYQKRPDVLYERLKEHLQQYLIQVEKEGDELFQKETDEQALRFYIKTWEVYKHGSESVGNTFLYLSSFHVGKGLQLFPIRHLALLTWKEVIIEKNYEQWTTTILNLISRARKGEELNSSVIHSGSILYSEFDSLLEYIVKHPRDTTQSSSIIGKAQPESRGVELFSTRFEKRFIEESSLFYSNENLLECENLTQYQRGIERIVPLEEKIGEALLLHNVTLESNIKMCKNVQKALLQKHWAEYIEEFKSEFSTKKTEVIKRVYILLNSLEMTNELDEMKECFLNHLSSAFQQSTFAHQNMARNHSDGVLRVHRERNVIVTMIFENDAKLLETLNKQCVQFLTQNSTQKPSELLAEYCNFLLKKSKHKISELELDAALNQVLCLYEFLEDKGLFKNLYRKMMAHRLVNGMSSGKEEEFMMVEKMQLKLEFQYVSKLNRMLKDVAVSKQLVEKFNHFLAQKDLSLSLVFDIQVFASVNFPSSNFTQLELPTSLQQCVETFEQFHMATYHNRKLHWLHNSHSRGEILSNCFKKPYCFKATTLQMTVLLLFNSMDTYSIGELAELTKFGINSLLQVLESFIKAKILITGNGEKAVDLNNDSVISLVKEYDNGRLHVNIASPLK